MDTLAPQDLHTAILRALPDALGGYLDPTLIVLSAAAAGVLARFTVFRWLRRLSLLNKSPYDDIIVDGLKRRVVAWTVLGALYLQVPALPWQPGARATVQTVLAALLVASVTLALMRLVSALVHAYGTISAAGVGGTTLIRYISTSILLFIGVVSVLALFGISVVPAITALGVGGLAVALAFQDTLANVFSGINLTLARQIRVGDYIELGERRRGLRRRHRLARDDPARARRPAGPHPQQEARRVGDDQLLAPEQPCHGRGGVPRRRTAATPSASRRS
jgi:small-conductance mechanosensitive channel